MMLISLKLQNNRIYNIIVSIVLALLTIVAYHLNLLPATIPQNITELTIYNFSVFRLLVELLYSMGNPDWFSFFLCIPLAYMYNNLLFSKKSLKKHIVIMTLSVLIVFILLMCKSFHMVNSWDLIFADKKSFTKALFKTIGLTPMVYIVVDYLFNKTFNIIDYHCEVQIKPLKFILTTTLLLLACWSIYFVLLYPGCLAPDGLDQLAQILNNKDVCWTDNTVILLDENVILNNHHPVLYAVVLKFFVLIGRFINSYEIAFELLCVIQALLLALAFSYMMYVMKKHGLKRKLLISTFIFCAFNPLFPIYSMTIVKDAIFCVLFVLTAVQLYELLVLEKFCWLRSVLFGTTIIVFLLTRNNSFYILLLTLVCMVALFWKEKKKLLKVATNLLIPILIFQIGFINILYPVLKITPGSKREMLSIPFLQTARYVKEYPEEISETDEKIIATVLNCEGGTKGLANLYNPKHADSVKNRFNKYSTTSDLVSYFKVWAKGLVKHPDVYIEAYLNLHYGWFSFEGNDFIAYSAVSPVNITGVIPEYQGSMGSNSARSIVNKGLDLLNKNPITTLFLEMSTYTWAYLFLIIFSLKTKSKAGFIITLLSAFNFIISLVGPVAYMRYAIPMVCLAPFSMFAVLNNTKDNV